MHVQWIRSDRWWLWPGSFQGGQRQKPDHGGPRRETASFQTVCWEAWRGFWEGCLFFKDQVDLRGSQC